MSFWFEVLVYGILQFIKWIIAAVLVFIVIFGPLFLVIHMSPWYMAIYFVYLFALALFVEYLKRR